jgi:hypothetical protein
MSARHHRLARTLAGALALSAIAAPTAGALPAEQVQGGSPSTNAAPAIDKTEALAPTVTRTIDEGFDWGSAAMGAGGATALLLLTGAGATAVSHRHRRVGVVR